MPTTPCTANPSEPILPPTQFILPITGPIQNGLPVISADNQGRRCPEGSGGQSFSCWIELYQQTQCVIRNPNTYKRCGRHAILLADDCKFMVQLVCLEPGLFLEEIRERLYNSTGTQLSYQAVHDNLVNRLSITLKKPSTGNCQKNLVAKYAFFKQMECFLAESIIFLDKSPFCDRDMLRSHAWAEHGASATQLIVNQNAE
ncbi:hypothetical protein PSTG_03162 [Puccinia striiformis f. sp. tritici PST-78]|uniref:Uncharacterized protein n=1 Tax=Puccinia striiformis f. sp. tritici PST-78 TaxID=1165861 RepID=A0A0L0VWJ2_9BASI|nr:hypothetical protein PSTG_03162 [Puccinia striiformis f. sp. tritici PST-78]